METHGVKHHYHLHHHHHQTTQPASHHSNHSSLSNSQPFSFGSNPSPGQSQSSSSKLNFETSAAFPLLLSSIESGRVNFVNPKPVAFARPKCSSTFSCNQNGNVNPSQAPSDSSQHSSNTLTHSSQVGAGKHRHESLQQSNGGVKATPKQKSAATPNLIASSGRQQAFGHSTNGHAQARSQASHLTGEAAVVVAGAATLPHGGGLSFKKNFHARETPLNNNGTCNRSRTSPNKENKTAALPATTAAPTSATTTGASNGAPGAATANRRPSIRSPTRTSGSNAAKSAPGSGNVPPFNNSYNHQRATSAVERITNGIVEGPHGIVPNHRPPPTALAPSQTCPSKPRPLKEFKFFKERAKDKLNKYQGTNTGNDMDSGAKTGSKAISKFSLSSNSTKGKSSGAVKGTSTKRSPKTAKANGLQGKSKSNINNCESAIGDKASSQPPPPAKLFLPDTAVTAVWKDSPVGEPAVKANTSATSATEDGEQIQIVYYREAIVDGFTFQAFDDIESLEVSH